LHCRPFSGGADNEYLTAASGSFEDLYDQTTSSLLNKTGKESFEALRMIKKADVRSYKPANHAVYPDTRLGNALKQNSGVN
jgi:hypothetical protein